MKHGVYFQECEDGNYYNVWVRGEFIGTELSCGSANWLFSFYDNKRG